MTYSFAYDGSSRPQWVKTFTASSGETFSAELTFDNENDRISLTQEQAFGYMEMLLQYAKDTVASLNLIQASETSPPQNPFPVRGNYKEYEWAMDTLNRWWFWAYFNDDFDTTPEPTDEPA